MAKSSDFKTIMFCYIFSFSVSKTIFRDETPRMYCMYTGKVCPGKYWSKSMTPPNSLSQDI